MTPETYELFHCKDGTKICKAALSWKRHYVVGLPDQIKRKYFNYDGDSAWKMKESITDSKFIWLCSHLEGFTPGSAALMSTLHFDLI